MYRLEFNHNRLKLMNIKDRARAGRVTRCVEVCILMRESQTIGTCADWETAAVVSEEAATCGL